MKQIHAGFPHRSSGPMRFLPPLMQLICLILICLTNGGSSVVLGQGDIFGSADESIEGTIFGDENPEPAAKPAAGKTADSVIPPTPLTRQLLGQATVGTNQLADAVNALSRTGRWAEVDRLLTGLDSTKLSNGVKAEMAKRIGPTEYLKINRREEVSDQAKGTLAELAKAQILESESPKRINAAISQLSSENIDQQAAAARVLFAGGDASIAVLADELTREKPTGDAERILSVYRRFGNRGIAPLRRFALYGNNSRRENALVMLGRLSSGDADLAAIAASQAIDATDAERAISSRHLRYENGRLPTFGQATDALWKDFIAKRETALLVDRDTQQITLWTLKSGSADNAEQKKNGKFTLKPIKASRLVAAYRDVVDSASRLSRLGQQSDDMRRALLNAELAYRMIVNPEWGDPKQAMSLMASSGANIDETFVLSAIDESVARTDDAATLGLVRLIAADAAVDQHRFDSDLLLRQNTASPTSLVKLASDASNVRIRFEAALLVTELASVSTEVHHARMPYAGSSRVSKTLSEIRSLSDRPRAILVETRPEIALLMEGLFVDLGFDVDVVPSAAALLSAIESGGDLELILAKTRLWDMTPIELVDRVRRMPRGRNIPIVLLDDVAGETEQVLLGERRWNAVARQIPIPTSAAALDDVWDVVARRSRLEELTPIERRQFRTQAAKALASR